MGCFALKRKPCAVIAHVIDQDIEPEEWAEVYDALSSVNAPRKQGERIRRESPHGLFFRRDSPRYQALGRDNLGEGIRVSEAGMHSRLNGSSQKGGVELLMSSARRGFSRKGELEVFACDSPEADPLLGLETFRWSKALGVRLRNARTGKLLMTLVPVKRPSTLPSVALPAECQLPGIDNEQLEGTWELCRIYADGRVVASLRGSPQPPCPPRSCWQDLSRPKNRRRRRCHQTFRVWIAAAGAVQAACSRCASFKTDDSSGHELTWALSRGLGVSLLGREAREKGGENVGRQESGVRKEVAEYWEGVANAQKNWERAQADGAEEGSVRGDAEHGVELPAERDVLAGEGPAECPRQETLPSSVEGLDERLKLGSESEAASTGTGASGRNGPWLNGGDPAASERDADGLGASGRLDGAGHVSRRSLESVNEFHECRSGRNSESGSEASARDLDAFRQGSVSLARGGSSKSLGGTGDPGWIPSPGVGVENERVEAAAHHRSRSAEGFRRSVSQGETPSRSSKFLRIEGHQADASCPREDDVAEPPLRQLGMLESFLSGGRQESSANDLERPLLTLKSSGLQYDPAPDFRALQPQGSIVPSGFNTSAMVPLIVEVTRAPFGKVEIGFSDAGGGAQPGESMVASARSSGFKCKKRLHLKVSATCPADILALTMLASYVREVVDLGTSLHDS